MEKNCKRKLKERGITLVALVITIIILLILAGVTLNLALGEGKILTRAKNTVDRYQAAQTNEQEQMAQLGQIVDKFGQGEGAGETDDPTPEEPGIEVTEENLKQYQGKYVDIGLDINENTNTTDDWEIFYAENGRIFLIAADYVPVGKLDEWGVIGDKTTLEANGFIQYSDSGYKYSVYWPNEPKEFLNLSQFSDDFLNLIKHEGYKLTEYQNNPNSIAVSHLLNKGAWNGIKTAATENKYIDFVIGGPTLEMWCAAWNKAVEGDSVFVTIEADPQTSGTGYNVKHGELSKDWLYMNGTQSDYENGELGVLGDEYKTFFPHTGPADNCEGYWLASPSASYLSYLMHVNSQGNLNGFRYSNGYYGVRPVVFLTSGVQLVEKQGGLYKCKISK